MLQVEHLPLDPPERRKNLFFTKKQGSKTANREISFAVRERMRLGVIGEARSGKEVLMRTLNDWSKAPRGTVFWEDEDLSTLKKARRKKVENQIQSLDLARTRTIGEGCQAKELLLQGLRYNFDFEEPKEEKIAFRKLIELCQFPGPKQNEPVARLSDEDCLFLSLGLALTFKPKLILWENYLIDADLRLRARVNKLLVDLEKRLGLALILSSSDLTTLIDVCSHVLILHEKKLVAFGEKKQVFQNPSHDYTRYLNRAIRNLAKRKYLSSSA